MILIDVELFWCDWINVRLFCYKIIWNGMIVFFLGLLCYRIIVSVLCDWVCVFKYVWINRYILRINLCWINII